MNTIELKMMPKQSDDIGILEQINEEAIPACERNSLDDMLSTGAEIIGIYADHLPVGFLVIRTHAQICYLAYLAVEKSLRSRGIGSRSVRAFLAAYKDYQIVVEFEAPESPCSSNDIKRFYMRNGFYETGWFTYYDETEFEIGCSQSVFDISGFRGFTEHLNTVISDHIPKPYRKDNPPL